MYCTHCGKEIADDAVVCTNCGVPVDGAPLALDAPLAEVPEKRRNPVAPVGFSLSVAGGVLSIISLLASSAEFFLLFGLVTLAGLVCSIVGLTLAKKRRSGFGFALAGVITATVVIIGMIVILILAFFAAAALFYLLFALLMAAGG